MKFSSAKRLPTAESRPLCVDLDHTLIRTDSLHEGLLKLIFQHPLQALKIPYWFLKGRPFLKERVSDIIQLAPDLLPYNMEVISFLRKEQQRGRKIFLVTGAHRNVALPISNHLRIFAGVYATTKDTNLVGPEKAALLVNKFGEKGFDYVGDNAKDLAIWRHAKKLLLVNVTWSVKRKAKNLGNSEEISTEKLRIFSFVKAIRCHQWIKNILLFFPAIFAHQLQSFVPFINAFYGFFAFSFSASAIYLINDLSDLDADRKHPDKKYRPIASGALPIPQALLLVPLLVFASYQFASFLSPRFGGILIGYVVLSNLYTFWLKKIAIADVLILATLFTCRLFAGSVATETVLSPWLIAFTVFFFFSLALVKRCSELITLEKLGLESSNRRGYMIGDTNFIMAFGVASGYLAVLVLALYLNSTNAKNLYEYRELLWALTPITLYWVSRIWLITGRDQMHSDPITFVVKDRVSWFLVLSVFLIWIFATGKHLV